jgi:hypothetical protein
MGDKMIVTDLASMEKIVSQNRSLAWVGWDVVERKKTDMGRTAVNGVRVKDQWYTQKVFKLDRLGWDIPNKYKV